MSDLHEALSHLSPKDFADIPIDSLDTFLPETFAKAELIVNSVPPPAGGDDFLDSRVSRSQLNAAKTAAEMHVSKARPPPPAPEHAELYKSWGKPLKLSSKDNPLDISVYKMAGKDRHGAWFARRSVHEGLGFSKWKRAMQMEFAASLAVKGGPGEGNVRGIGSDKRMEQTTIEGLGKLEVYQLSAQFPGPVAPREFVTLLITSDNALSDKSSPHVDASHIPKHVPRHFMIVSIPVTHPDAPLRDGLVRGQYESVEMIREIPLPRSDKSASTGDLLNAELSPSQTRRRGSTIGFAESRGPDAKGEKRDLGFDDEEEDLNPVEWIMVTRSDPGGGIPRFMVERGTPGSIVADASKFLDWACGKDDFEIDEGKSNDLVAANSRKSSESRRFSAIENNAYLSGVGDSIADRPVPTRTRSQHTVQTQEQDQSSSGMFASIANMIPGSFQSALPASLRPSAGPETDATEDVADDSSSLAESFASADEYNEANSSSNPPSIAPSADQLLSDSASGIASPRPESRHARELSKIERQKLELKTKLEKQREQDAKNLENAKTKSEEAAAKAKEKHEREKKKQEERYEKEMQKLEARREKEAKRLEERLKKEAEKNEVTKAQRERDEWKSKAEISERENAILKEQIGELQKENTALVTKLGKLDGGLSALKSVQAESGLSTTSLRSRADSGESLSIRSGKSVASATSGLKDGETVEK